MEGYSRKEEGSLQLLDLIPKEGKWVQGGGNLGGPSEDNSKLELSLGLPGSGGCWGIKDNPCVENQAFKSPWFEQTEVKEESLQDCNNSSAQKRSGGQVVGWPPIRSFRKNIASGSGASKPTPVCKDAYPLRLLVKVNMDGIPIGRKVDLKAYDSYDELSLAVDELFRDLLPGQRGSCSSGECTLVYEDNEGDMILVGDVPWHMFVSTAKRLRVLRSSEVPKLSGGSKPASTLQ